MLRTSFLGVAVGLILAGSSFAQFQSPGPEHERLKEIVGSWDAVMDIGGQKSPATAVYKSIAGGMWIVNDYQGEVLGQKFTGHGIDGYDQTKKKYVGLWFDSVSSAPLRYEGDYDEATKTLTMTGESTDPEGKPQKFKNVMVAKDADHFTFTMYMVGPDGQDLKAFSIEYTRKK